MVFRLSCGVCLGIYVGASMVTGFLMSGSALAQGVVDPLRLREQLDAPMLDRPDVTPSAEVPQVQMIVPEQMDKAIFNLEALDIDGAQVFTADALAVLYRDYIGKSISVSTLYRIAERINQHYYDAGYVFAKVIVPPQEIGAGRARLRVIEGHIADVRVDAEGNLGDHDIIQRTLGGLPIGKALQLKDIEEALLRLRDLPGLEVVSRLEAMDGEGVEAGALRFVVSLKDDANVRFRVGVNNYGSRFVGPYQLQQDVAFENVFGDFGQTRLTLSQASQVSEMKYGEISHRAPLFGRDIMWRAGVAYGSYEPGYTLLDLDFETEAKRVFVGVDGPIVRRRDRSVRWILGLERNESETLSLRNRLSHDVISVADLGLQGNYAGLSGGHGYAYVKLRKGFDILGGRESGSADLSRVQGRSNFISVQAGGAHLQALSKDWSLLGRLRGQYAPHPLLASEEFGYGGVAAGRAYNSSDFTGDSGLSFLAELRYDGLDNVGGLSVQPYAFYDIGKVWNRDATNAGDISAASAGAGLRLGGGDGGGLSVDMFAAKPLTQDVQNSQWNSDRGAQFKFALSYSF